MKPVEALLLHAKSHGELMPVDVIKFLHQAEFGCGHLISDFTSAQERFYDEWEKAEPNSEPVFEELGAGYCRVNLSAAKATGAQGSMLMRMFYESAHPCGKAEHMLLQLNRALECAEKGELKISSKDLREEIEKYTQQELPPVSHSQKYREMYKPSYRVIKAEYCFYFDLFFKIFELLQQKPTPLIVIDGMAAAGKTMLSELISSIVPCNVVHADSFFLPDELRDENRMSELGGRLHYERLKDEVLDKLGEDELSYRIFDCESMDYKDTKRISSDLPVILEGSYSTSPKAGAKADISVFLKTSAEKQAQRILARNGKAMLHRFVNEWIPAENAFFKETSTQDKCDFVFKT